MSFLKKVATAANPDEHIVYLPFDATKEDLLDVLKEALDRAGALPPGTTLKFKTITKKSWTVNVHYKISNEPSTKKNRL